MKSRGEDIIDGNSLGNGNVFARPWEEGKNKGTGKRIVDSTAVWATVFVGFLVGGRGQSSCLFWRRGGQWGRDEPRSGRKGVLVSGKRRKYGPDSTGKNHTGGKSHERSELLMFHFYYRKGALLDSFNIAQKKRFSRNLSVV